MKKLLSFILALIFTCGLMGTGLAQQAAPEESAVGAEQAAPKKSKKAKQKKSKKQKKTKKAADTAVQ